MKERKIPTTLTRANSALRGGAYSEAIELYEIVLTEQPELSGAVSFNIDFAINRLTRSLSAQDEAEYSRTAITIETAKIEEPNLKNDETKIPTTIAVVVHIYYEHLWPQISQYLDNVGVAFRLIVTYPLEKDLIIREMISKKYISVDYMPVSNFGMDVFPFIKAVNHYKLWNCSAILKIHTKNDKTEDREIQGRMLLDGVLASKATVERILRELTAKNDVGIVGSELLFRSGDLLMYNNRKLYHELLSILNITHPSSGFGFIAGTIFWIKGDILKSIESSYEQLERIFSFGEIAKTGGDGTYAHAMERVFGALPAALNLKSAVTYPISVDPLDYDLKIIENSSIVSNPIYRTGSGTHIVRYKHLSAISNSIRRSSLFDQNHYISQLPPQTIHNDDPAIHYTLNSEQFLASPSTEFDERYYLARYKDIPRTRSPALIHFINHGKRENRVYAPSDSDWIELAFRERLIKTHWQGKLDELCVILKHGGPEKCLAVYSNNYNPYLIPKLAYFVRHHNAFDVLKVYLRGVLHEELELYDLIERTWSNGDYKSSAYLAQEALSKYGRNKISLEVLGGSQLMQQKWDEAIETFSEYWKMVQIDKKVVERGKGSVLRIDQPTTENLDFKIIDKKDLTLETGIKNKRVCVYTTLFGAIDNLLPVITDKHGIEFICFSDVAREAMGWDVRVVDSEFESSNLSAKKYKILPHIVLPDYDYSLFVDANTLFTGRIDSLINLCLLGGDFVMWRHPLRRDIFKESIAIIASKRHEPKLLINQIKTYAEHGLPYNTGLTEGSFIWRSHNNVDVSDFMTEWWTEIINGSNRDQVSLGYLMWQKQVRPSVFPAVLGTSRENIFFVKVPHNFETQRSSVAYRPLPRKRNIVFLYSKGYANSGSTVMRGGQLSEIIKTYYSGKRTVQYKSTPKNVKNSIVFLTKGFLKSATTVELEQLKNSGNMLLADFVDDIPDKSKLTFIDALIASSISSYKYYMTTLCHIPAFLLTHHVDPRVLKHSARQRNKFDQCKIGYFGELANSIHTPELAEYVNYHNVDTSQQESSWIEKLNFYNCHFAVRERRSIDGFKPFLKGFTAAATNSNIIIQRTEGDVPFYLGDDYPYLISDGASIQETLDMVIKVKDSFDSKEWHYGLEILENVRNRSSNFQIVSEFKNIINTLDS